MIFSEIKLKGAFVIDLELLTDQRGFFARSFCSKEFEAHGPNPNLVQCNLSFNYKKGTLRGMHYQIAPFAETKLIRCIRGAIYDVIIDLRPESETYLSYIGVELTAENRRALYVPQRFAHGFQSLTDESEVMYQMGEFHAPEYAFGLRYNDSALGIEWPLPVSEISQKDLSWPLLESVTVKTFSHVAGV